MDSNKYTESINNSLASYLKVREIKDGWKELKKDKDFTVYSQKYQKYDINLAKVEGTIPANYEKVAKYYHECLDLQKAQREMTDVLKVVETIDNDTIVYYSLSKGKLLISPRELVGLQHRRRLSENEIVIIRNNLTEHPQVAPHKGSVRGEQIVFAIFIEKVNDNLTKLTLLSLMDPKGSIPTSIINSMLEKSVSVFNLDSQQIQKL